VHRLQQRNGKPKIFLEVFLSKNDKYWSSKKPGRLQIASIIIEKQDPYRERELQRYAEGHSSLWLNSDLCMYEKKKPTLGQ
jgi:hypothetical protein